jgi:hypothetical protein
LLEHRIEIGFFFIKNNSLDTLHVWNIEGPKLNSCLEFKKPLAWNKNLYTRNQKPHAKGFEIVGSSGKNKISLGAR